MASRTNAGIGSVSVVAAKVVKSAHFCLLSGTESEPLTGLTNT